MRPQYLHSFVTTYLSERKKLKALSRMSRAEADDYQLRCFKAVVEHAWSHVPFYRRLWAERGFEPSQLVTLSDVAKIPVIDRNDIVAHCDEFIADDVDRRRLSLVTSGGTTGMPIRFYLDKYVARGREMAYLRHIYGKYFRCRAFDRVAIFRGLSVSDELAAKKIFWSYSYEQRGMAFSPFYFTAANFDRYMAALRRYDPAVIRAYPSTIAELCMLMKARGEKPLKSLRCVICSSENLYEWHRRLVRDVLGVEAYSLYGHSEKCVIAFQGDAEGNMLFHPGYGYTEFLCGDDMRPAHVGELAEVVVTGFGHDYFPLIRYRTDDVVETGEPTGIFGRVARRIVGREQDFVIDRHGNKIHFTNQDEPFYDITGVRAYQYVQSERGVLNLNIQVDSGFDTETASRLQHEVEQKFVDFDIIITKVDAIERTARGKFRYLVQHLDVACLDGTDD